MKSVISLLVLFLLTQSSCIYSQDYKFTHAQFSENYKKENNTKYSIEIPQVQELVHIIFAITGKGITDTDMIDQETLYYQQVIEYFKGFKNEKIVQIFDKKLKGSLFMNGAGAYSRLKMDACGFYFEGDKILKDTNYSQLNWDNKNYIVEYVDDLEDFAKKSNFLAFFSQNKAYYDELLKKSEEQFQIKKQWQWLEARFPYRYNHYRITFSPLVNGSHSTNRFQSEDFRQTVMFVCAPFEMKNVNPKLPEAILQRIVFTEIDHNYVNPVTDKFKTQINQIFNNRQKWASGEVAKSYGSPYSVFNEYMTWAVFSLYASDTFEEAVFVELNRRNENQMTKNRGFNKFKEFNQKLLELYQTNKPKSIEELYQPMMDWCKTQ